MIVLHSALDVVDVLHGCPCCVCSFPKQRLRVGVLIYFPKQRLRVGVLTFLLRMGDEGRAQSAVYAWAEHWAKHWVAERRAQSAVNERCERLG